MPKASSEWSIAKPLLEQDFCSVEGIEAMTHDQVIGLRPGVYDKVVRKNFVANWNKMKKRMKEKELENQGHIPQKKSSGRKKSGPTAWEIAKPLLEEDFKSGVATPDMKIDQVIELRKTIYGKVPKSNFATNWRALKKRINDDDDAAKRDREDYDHDVAIYTLAKDCPWEWHGSDAESSLKRDVAKGRHMRYHPSVLYLKRDAYQEFDYEVFRKHVHQEARSALEQPYWMVQKEKKEKKKRELDEAVKKAVREAEMQELWDAFEELHLDEAQLEELCTSYLDDE